MPFRTTTEVDLEPGWVSDLLITAFDGQYGGCNYWLREQMQQDGAERLVGLTINTQPVVGIPLRRSDVWDSVTLWFPEIEGEPLTLFNATERSIGQHMMVHLGEFNDAFHRSVTVQKAHLDAAWAHIVNKRPIRQDLVEQFTRSMVYNDLDVDADAADCLVQIALFGEVVYG